MFKKISEERKTEVLEHIQLGSVPHSGFYILVILSTLIAGYGLLSNSVAVIIGAMLVAPLMTPIFGLATSLVNGDKGLFKHSLKSEFVGIFISIGTALLVGIFAPRIDFGNEIMARTNPTLFDLAIAIAAGLAGSYSLVDKRLSPTLPGVAIATALVPPLAVCGLCLSNREFVHAFGALLLFVANFVAIQLSCSAVFWLYGFAPFGQLNNRKEIFRRFGLSTILLILLAIFMSYTLYRLVTQQNYEQVLRRALTEQVHIIPGARLQEIQEDKKGNVLYITAVVQTPTSFSPKQVLGIQQIVRERTGKSLNLTVRSVITQDVLPSNVGQD